MKQFRRWTVNDLFFPQSWGALETIFGGAAKHLYILHNKYSDQARQGKELTFPTLVLYFIAKRYSSKEGKDGSNSGAD